MHKSIMDRQFNLFPLMHDYTTTMVESFRAFQWKIEGKRPHLGHSNDSSAKKRITRGLSSQRP